MPENNSELEKKGKELDMVVHQWCDDNDRWMYIEYDRDGKVMGLNFMQGNEYEIFKEAYCTADRGMTDFYQSMLYTFPIEQQSCSALSFINKCMWAYFTAVSCSENPE
jgi:hypothetical protein